MVHGSEAVLLTDIDYESPRAQAYTDEGNQVFLEDAIDQLDEARDVVLLYSARYQHAMRCYHSRTVRKRALQVEDLVLRWVQSNKGSHKLSPLWEGPFIIDQVLRPGTYKLKDEGGRLISNAWNIEQLRRFYP
jgi:hypothetical protein